MTVGIGHVRFDVVDGRAVHQVCAEHMEHRSAWGVPLDMVETHRRQPETIRPERTAAGKDTHPLIAAKARRPHGETGRRMAVGREAPHQPQIVKVLDAAQRVGVAVGLLQNDLSTQLRHDAALLGNAKLTAERRMKRCDLLYFHTASQIDDIDNDDIAKVRKKTRMGKKEEYSQSLTISFYRHLLSSLGHPSSKIGDYIDPLICFAGLGWGYPP